MLDILTRVGRSADVLYLNVGLRTKDITSLFITHGNDAYITHNAPEPLSDITGGNLPDYVQLPLEPLKTSTALLFFFFPIPHVQSYYPRPVNTLYCVRSVDVPFKVKAAIPEV